MDNGDLENIAWGGMGGIVRWFREPPHALWKDRIFNLFSSLVGGVCVGKVVSTVIHHAMPSVGEDMITASWIVSGFGSGIIIQLTNHILGDAATIARSWCAGAVSGWFDRLKKRPNGTTTSQSGQPGSAEPSAVVGERGVLVSPVLPIAADRGVPQRSGEGEGP